jgi:hypothetical protein
MSRRTARRFNLEDDGALPFRQLEPDVPTAHHRRGVPLVPGHATQATPESDRRLRRELIRAGFITPRSTGGSGGSA